MSTGVIKNSAQASNVLYNRIITDAGFDDFSQPNKIIFNVGTKWILDNVNYENTVEFEFLKITNTFVAPNQGQFNLIVVNENNGFELVQGFPATAAVYPTIPPNTLIHTVVYFNNNTVTTSIAPDLSGKVDKVAAHSLISDAEKLRLSTVINFDNTDNVTAQNNEATTRANADIGLTNTIAQVYLNLTDGVATEGNTLQKLYNLIIGSFTEITVNDIADRDAYDVLTLPFNIFVENDGDGKWALYKATTTGVGATFVKINDQDSLNNALTASSIKAAYESNPDTNAFTNALLNKLNSWNSVNTQENYTLLEKEKLASITAIFTTALKIAYDNTVTWINTNGANLLAHLTNNSNPHNTTASQVGAPSGSGTSTGTNTGDETSASISTITNSATSKTTLLDADTIVGNNSVTPFGLIKITMLNIWNYIKSKLTAELSQTFDITTSQTAQEEWNNKTIFIKANITITIPSTLSPGWNVNYRVFPSFTLNLAITTPHFWEAGTDLTPIPAKTYGAFIKDANTNTIILIR